MFASKSAVRDLQDFVLLLGDDTHDAERKAKHAEALAHSAHTSIASLFQFSIEDDQAINALWRSVVALEEAVFGPVKPVTPKPAKKATSKTPTVSAKSPTAAPKTGVKGTSKATKAVAAPSRTKKA